MKTFIKFINFFNCYYINVLEQILVIVKFRKSPYSVLNVISNLKIEIQSISIPGLAI